MATTKSADDFLKIVNGYVRDQNKLWKMNIPNDINKIIFLFYRMIIDSKILTQKEHEKLYEMISDKMESKQLNFNLIYRGTQDGFGFSDFYDKCNKIKPVIVIVETTKDIVCGGYTSVGFIKNADMEYKDERAFLYSIRTNNSKYPPKIFHILPGYEDEAIGFCTGYLCCFANSGIWLEANCNRPGTNSGISGLDYIPSNQDNYLTGGDSKSVGIQVKELELFQLTFQ